MRHSLTLMCFYATLFIPAVDSSVVDGLVSTPWGKIRGVPKTSVSGPNYTSFEGIPYAKPPLGNLRFSKPEPSTGSQKTVLIADSVKPSCLVANISRESEDCLYLDLYVPHSDSNESSPLPVMVYFHGGGFLLYPGDAFPEYLLPRGVIVALVHYRLGAMGFLSTGDDVLKGNYGLWDQRMAIQWVKDNVAAFGSDPKTITVFGESAGSASVAYQMLAPNSNDLFQRAILLSGTATSSWAFGRDPSQYAHELGHRLGCTSGSSSADLAKCLREVDGIRLQKEVVSLWHESPYSKGLIDFIFVPVIDHEFILDEPLKLIQNTSHLETVGAFDKSVIIGVLNRESSLVLAQSSVANPPDFGDYFANDMIPFMLRQRYGVSTPKSEEAVDSFYRQNVSRQLLDKYMVSNAFADIQFVIPALEFVEVLSKSKNSAGRQYFYYFDYCPSFSSKECMVHGLDLAFIFSSPMYPLKFTADDERICDVFASLLTSFAKTGIPVALKTPTWPPFSPETKAYLQISTQPEVKQNVFPHRRKFWSTTVPSLLSKSSWVHDCASSSLYLVSFLIILRLA